jgi:hypothetical protein
MSDHEVLPVNFTISAAAKLEIENLKNVWNTSSLDPAVVVVIGWGLFRSNSGKRWENVFVTFYGKSQLPRSHTESRMRLDFLSFLHHA